MKTVNLLLWAAVVSCVKISAQDATTQTSAPQRPTAAQASTAQVSAAQASDAQASPKKADTGNAVGRRFFYGVRVENTPLRLFDTSTRQSSTAQPIADYVYSANSSSQKNAFAGTFEYVATRHWSGEVEFYLTHAKFIQTTDVRTGLPNPNSSTDDRPVTMYVSGSKANYWVVPLLARYQGIRRSGFFSRAYAVGGLEYRHVGRVRTDTDIYYPDGSTGYNEVSVTPTHRDQVGFVAGVGLRFMDQAGLKLTPEIRYIRWATDTFQGPGYASTKNQAEIGLGFSF